MAVLTRIDARSVKNNAIQVKDLDGNILCTIEAMPTERSDNAEAMRNEVNLRLCASDKVVFVKSNGKVLRKR